MTFNFTKIAVFALFLILNSCAGGMPGGDARKNSPDPKERVKKNLETGKGFRLNNLLDKGGNFEFASSNELWRASLDTLGFMPLVSANYSGGIIITDWYSENKKSDYIKITLRFLSNEVRSDAIDIKIFYKNCDTLMNCTTTERDNELKKELKKEILKKAAIYKKQKVDKNFKPYTPSSLSKR
tara:strand:+ start:224 stop:772 length:549 start_codon:yes stop_codon:yes gene_type:complete